ncbi:hypothetical protein [Prevotella sp. tf2-5]|uniref:hypothetical protein n=1 Tax=Prevotella sp. tf2-5 TaxID=1761889 RepID=UPI0008EABAE8|nr:hypothetical protein [Prevotella sp. tf2-5]SFO41969.1 hypothetical protein SAMN04487852_10110 [Prevotella sp. tf2-5]
MRIKRKRILWLKFDRLLSKSLLRQFAILGAVLVVALGLSYLMLSWSGTQWKEFCDAEHLNKYLLPLYLLTDSNALNNLYMGSDNTHVHGWMLIASSLIFLFGAFVFNGIIIGVITNSIERRVNSHKEGRIHYLKSGHYIIMGYDEMVPSFISHIFDKDKDAYILILTAKETMSIKEQLLKSFSDKQMERVIINYGHRISTEAFKDIYLEAAEEVFVVGNHSNPAHDAINVECVDSISRYLKDQRQKPVRITCVFKDLDTYAAFKTSEIFGDVKNLGVEFVPYNFYTGWAKQVFVKRLYRDFDNPGTEYRYPLVYGKGIVPDDEKYVHLVFVGTTNFAVAFAMEAAYVLHFPNGPKVKTIITFIDVNADKEKDEFITRNRHFFEVQAYTYRDLSAEPKDVSEYIGKEYLKFTGEDANFLDVEFEFIKGDVFSKNVQDVISSWAEEHSEGKQCFSIFLALADQRQNFVMGMNMPDEVYNNEIPVFIRQNRSDNFVTNLRNADMRRGDKKLIYSVVTKDDVVESKKSDARYAHIYPFGMNETAFSADDHSLKRAKLINYLYETADYETYKFQGIPVLDAIPEDKIWEEANSCWQKLSVALKWSNLYNSYTMRTKQRTLRAMRGLDIDDESHDYDTLSEYELEQLAIVEHNRWNVEKLLMGFRKPRKDEDMYEHEEFADSLKKNKDLFIHHDIRPFSQLDTIKKLDYEFSRYIPWIMKMTEK